IVGPATAGAIATAFGPGVCYTLDVISFVLSAALIGSVMIKRSQPPSAAGESSSNRIHVIWRDMREGMSFIIHHAAVLFVVLAMAAGLFTIGCFGPLIAIYVRDNLQGSARFFGFVSGTIGIGLLLGTQLLRKLTPHVADDTMVLSGLAGIGLGVFILG